MGLVLMEAIYVISEVGAQPGHRFRVGKHLARKWVAQGRARLVPDEELQKEAKEQAQVKRRKERDRLWECCVEWAKRWWPVIRIVQIVFRIVIKGG